MRDITPNVNVKLTDTSSVRGATSGYITLDTAAFQSGRRTGKSFMAQRHMELISNRWQFLYHYGDVKTPELEYVASNSAFMDSRNKLPRGVQRKLEGLEKAKSVKVKKDQHDSVGIYQAITPACRGCGEGSMMLTYVTGRYGNYACKSCGHSDKYSATGRILSEPQMQELKSVEEPRPSFHDFEE